MDQICVILKEIMFYDIHYKNYFLISSDVKYKRKGSGFHFLPLWMNRLIWHIFMFSEIFGTRTMSASSLAWADSAPPPPPPPNPPFRTSLRSLKLSKWDLLVNSTSETVSFDVRKVGWWRHMTWELPHHFWQERRSPLVFVWRASWSAILDFWISQKHPSKLIKN